MTRPPAAPRGGADQTDGETSALRLTRLVARRDYLRAVRRRGYIFGTLLLPLGIAALIAISAFFSVEATPGSTSGDIVIVNESSVPLEDISEGPIKLTTLSADEARSQLESGQIADYYVVPADLASSGVVRHVRGLSLGFV